MTIVRREAYELFQLFRSCDLIAHITAIINSEQMEVPQLNSSILLKIIKSFSGINRNLFLVISSAKETTIHEVFCIDTVPFEFCKQTKKKQYQQTTF